jgi:RNA polymerase sigma-70 factor, ECF subfamily
MSLNPPGVPRPSGCTGALMRLNEVADSLSETEDDNAETECDELRRRALELVRGEFEERTWQMFWQTVVEDRPAADVAAELSVSAAAVRMARSRVLRRLRDEFDELIS